MTINAFFHIEWSSTDLERSRRFYDSLFEWTFLPFGDDYLLFEDTEGTSGGIMRVDEVVVGRSPCVYIEVDDLKETIEKARANGGTLADPPREMPSMGRFAHITDPDGNFVGIYEVSQD